MLDKSTLEMLSHLEIETLSRHYTLVIPPILLDEILGDLYKGQDKVVSNENKIDTTIIKKLANKIFTHSAYKNTSYLGMCVESLLGNDFMDNFCPFVQPTEVGTTTDGKTAAIINPDEGLKMIHDWKEGKFDKDQMECAKAWRMVNLNLEDYKKDVQAIVPNIQANTLKDIFYTLSVRFDNVSDVNFHWKLINGFCDALAIPSEYRDQIAIRWQQQPSKFKQFAPYAYYCFLVRYTFIFGLAKNLIPTSKKAKARIDIQYAYYFPCARIFSSEDGFHNELWQAFGHSEQQLFVNGSTLKEDLGNLHLHWETCSQEHKQNLYRTLPHPPVIEDSFTYKAFQKMVELDVLTPREQLESHQMIKRSPEEEKALVERIITNYEAVKQGKV